MKLRNKLTLMQCMVIVIIAIAYISAMRVFSLIYDDIVFENAEHILYEISDRIEQEISIKKEIATKIAIDPAVRENIPMLLEKNMNYKKIKTIESLKHLIDTYTLSVRNVVGSLLIDINATTEVMTGEFKYPLGVSAINILDALKNNGKETKLLYFDTAPNAVYVCSRVGKGGIYVMEIDMAELLYFTVNVSDNSVFKLIITDGDYPVFMEKSLKGIKFNTFTDDGGEKHKFTQHDGNRYMYLVKNNAPSGWSYIVLEEYNAIYKGLNRFNVIFYAILFLMLTVTCLLYFYLTKKTALPIENLTKKIRNSVDGITSDKMRNNNSNNEILLLEQDLDVLIRKMRKIIKDDYNKQLMLKDIEYRMLQMQISPHFLNNTLQTISAMAKIGYADKIPEVIKKLGNLLTASMDDKFVMHTVGEEIEILHDYVDIQKEKHGDRLKFIVDDSLYDTENLIVPKMILQPLVENCIHHVLEKIPDECRIELRANLDNDVAKIMVLDNGYGIPSKKVTQILNGELDNEARGIGLYNVNKRIKYYFGDNYGIKIHHLPQGGNCVEVLIPKVYNTKE